MAKLYSKFAIGEQFCKAVGIDPNVVTAVTFESRVGQVERATIEYYTEIGSIEIGEFVSTGRRGQRPPASRRPLMLNVGSCWMLRW